MKRQATKYVGEDIAKAMDIIRHVQAVYGLNRNPEEYENGLVRMEVVDQRDGVPEGRCYFRVEAAHQRMDELTLREIEELTQVGVLYDPHAQDGPEPGQEDTLSKGDM
jgi:hypothetical protein